MRIAAANVFIESEYRNEKRIAAEESLTIRDTHGIAAQKRLAVDTVRISAVAAEARLSSAVALRSFLENASRRAGKATETQHEIREENESRIQLIKANSDKATEAADGEQPAIYTTAFVRTSDGMHVAVEYSIHLAQSPVAYRRTMIQMMDGQNADPPAIDFDDLSASAAAK